MPAAALDEVGFVVIGRNEGARLVACLASLNPKRNATVYVDSGSSDGSLEAAREAGAHAVSLDLSTPFTAARARNAGYRELKRQRPDIELIHFIDGDCILNPGWLAQAVAFMADHPEVAIVCGRLRERFPAASVYNRLCDIEWDTPIGEAQACGGIALFRARAFDAIGGFRDALIAGEEPELCLRLRERGWKIWRLDGEMAAHDANMFHFAQFWRRSTRTGYAYAEITWIHRSSPIGIWRINLARAIFWGGVLPLVILAGALVSKLFLVLLLAYPLQVARMARSRGPGERFSWIFATLSYASKFAEFLGFLKYAWRRLLGAPSVIIEYK